ncbi:MAG: energy-coupling factor ABC transporter permease [Candidatus Zixiibacteriota bacterium]|jgi:cobalt/nickel transport system permease protein
MAHLHVPDGVLPFYLWAVGYAVVALGLIALWVKFRRAGDLRSFARAGFFAALTVVAMSFHIAPLGYHLNLVALAGIVAGPLPALLACLFANVILALLGHGGITVVGLNTITLGAEALVAFAAFRAGRFIRPTWPRAFVATVLALAASTTIAYVVVVTGMDDLGGVVERGRGLVDVHLPSVGEHAGERHEHEAEAPAGDVSPGRLAILFYGLGAVGWLIEGAVTATVAAYLKKAAPRLIAS